MIILMNQTLRKQANRWPIFITVNIIMALSPLLLVLLLAYLSNAVTLTKTWEQYILTDSITPAVTNVTDSKPLNYPFALPRNMSTSFYRYALSISGLQQNFPVSSSTGRYSVMLEVLNMSPSNMAIAIKTSLSTQNIAYLKVNYLLVDPTFPYIHIEHLNHIWTVRAAYGYATMNTIGIGVTYPVSTNDYVMHVIAGYDVQDSNSTTAAAQTISMLSYCYVTGINSIVCEVTHRVPTNQELDFVYAWKVEVVVFHEQQMMSNLFGATLLKNISFIDQVPYTRVETGVSVVDPQLLFYGFRGMSKNSSGMTPFVMNFSTPAGNSFFEVALGNYAMTLDYFFIYFQSTITCPSNYIWNDTAITCQICPATSYQTNNTCQPCTSLFPNCTYCNSTTCRYCQASLIFSGSACLPCSSIVGCGGCNSTACTSCLTPYVMGYSGCFLCGDVWGNCSDCNSSHCTNCSAPYQLNGSACFVCSDVWPQCTQCDGFSCLNCTAPYITNGSHCFLCQDQWPNCQQCTASGCLNCTSPYTNNVTNCFLCQDQWPNCQECDPSGCLNCTSPYINNVTNCFICSVQWPNCQECDGNTCFNCTVPYVLNGSSCFLCQTAWSQCTYCNNIQCLNCTAPHVTNGSDCFLCGDRWPNCQQCDGFTCLNCSLSYSFNGTDCFLCSDVWADCDQCTTAACSRCSSPYTLNTSTLCDLDCPMLIPNCTVCAFVYTRLTCSACDPGLSIQSNQCLPLCGDSQLALNIQTCDDGNTQDNDGCSSQCQIEEYFSCNSTVMPSVCQLTSMEATVKSMVKTQGKNQVVVSIDLFPRGLAMYQTADWLSSFSDFSHSMIAQSVHYDPSTSQLKLTLSYAQSLQDQSVQLTANFSSALSSPNLTSLRLTLPSASANNQALYYYSDFSYNLAIATKYLAWAVAGAAVVLMAVGYFGCKLQSLEGVAVVQVAGLLLMSVEDMGPSFSGLSKLKLALGVTVLSGQSSTVPSHLSSIIESNTPYALINIFLLLLIAPLLTALILKILASTAFKSSYRLQRAYKFALGSYTYYGLMFLTYGQFTLLALNLRYFKGEMDCYAGMLFGVAFTAVVVLWVIGSCKYQNWFGCFKKKFFIFQVSKYFYLFSTIERFITAFAVVCLSPGIIAPAALCAIFTTQAIFIFAKQPYILGGWKRPLFNKITTVVICLLYLAGSITSAESTINLILPLAILALLFAVVVVAGVASVYELSEFWSNKDDTAMEKKKDQRPMTVEEAQNKLMHDFQQKIMPNLSLNNSIFQPVKHQDSGVDKWKWQNYAVLNSIDLHHQLRTKLKGQSKLNCDQSEVIITEKESDTRLHSPIRRPNYDEI